VRKLAVTYVPGDGRDPKTVHVPEGTSLFNAAHWAGLPIDSTCGGRGTCGKCGVRIVSGPAARTTADYRHLSDKLDEGWRLSCQSIVTQDATCEVPRLMHTPKAATMGVGRFVLLEPNVSKFLLKLGSAEMEDPRSHIQRVRDALIDEGLEVTYGPALLGRLAPLLEDGATAVTATVVGEHLVDVGAGDTTSRMFGISFDIGTTTVVATLIDLTNGVTAAVGSTINGQAPFGADVIARIGHAMTGADALEDLRAAVVATVNGLIAEVCESGVVSASEVYECVVVGNATMLHLLLGVDPRSIALSPFVATFLEPLDLRAADVGFEIHPDGRIGLFPSIGAYVGADIVGDMVATGLAREPSRRLLVDVGTNGEIAVGSEDRVVATSAPAGPAFEGGQILHGMRATEGAIEGVVLTNGKVELQVIGGDGALPRGLCGSGLIDVVAQLRLSGILKRNGVLHTREELVAQGHPLASRIVERDGIRAFALTDEVLLTQLDVRELQSAKSAISTGIQVAMDALGVGPDDLDEVMLAGSFGTYINPVSARAIGLVPPVPVERIKAVGNTASEGAKMALLSFREREVAFELPGFVEYLELSGAIDFNERFIANVEFPAVESEEVGQTMREAL
jgi:uncharacterized 2Fe-2S/4Fe-4S cluster protein (DUF4445 family)